MIVALGASAVMITSQMMFVQYIPYGNTDPARLPAQVIAGVGFLGAGTILREGVSVKGLTTAASLWTVACLGIAAGAGYYEVALVGTGIMLVILTIFEKLQCMLFRKRQRICQFSIVCSDLSAAMEAVGQLLDGQEASITNVHMEHREEALQTIHLQITFHGRRIEQRLQSFTAQLSAQKVVQSVKTTFAETK